MRLEPHLLIIIPQIKDFSHIYLPVLSTRAQFPPLHKISRTLESRPCNNFLVVCLLQQLLVVLVNLLSFGIETGFLRSQTRETYEYILSTLNFNLPEKHEYILNTLNFNLPEKHEYILNTLNFNLLSFRAMMLERV